MRTPRLNNMGLANQRRELVYEAIMTDLVLMGALTNEMVEPYLGHKVPERLKPIQTVPNSTATIVNEEVDE